MTSPPLTIATYYVIPVKSVDPLENIEKVQACIYLDEDFEWVNKKKLVTDFNSNYIRILQLTVSPKYNPFNMFNKYIPVEMVQLLAAVAKTIGQTANLPNTFICSKFDVSNPAINLPTGVLITNQVLLPVSRGTKRGVILIFTRLDENGEIKELVASSDPEIKNS